MNESGENGTLIYYNRCYDSARLEKQWTNERLGWLFTPQAILFTALGVTFSDKVASTPSHVLLTIRIVIPLLGLTICVVVFIAVFCAAWMHEKWTSGLRTSALKLNKDGPVVTFGSKPYWPSVVARWFPLILPIAFGLAWLAIFLSLA